jgi:hypothetical protein
MKAPVLFGAGFCIAIFGWRTYRRGLESGALIVTYLPRDP